MATLPRGAETLLAQERDPDRRKLIREALAEVPVPEGLKRPLVFGDPAQVKALREYEEKLADIIGESVDEDGNPVEVEWEVKVEATCSGTIVVKASCREDAEEAARDDYGITDLDVDDWTVTSVRRKRSGT
jgi:hypothetical protein